MIHTQLRGFLALLCLLVVGVGCNPNPHGAKVQALDDLEDSLLVVKERLAMLSLDSLEVQRNWAVDELREFQVMLGDSGMHITRDEGLIVAEVTRAKRLLKDFPGGVERAQQRINRALVQVRGLRDLLNSGATTDGNGTLVDSAYIANNHAKELKIGQDLTRNANLLVDYAAQGAEVVTRTQSRTDSLKTVLRARLAALVLARADEPTAQ